MDNRPSRIFLDVESLNYVDIEQIVDVCKQAIQLKFGIQADMAIIDSCSDKIFVACFMHQFVPKNVFHVGAFVRRLVLSMTGPYRDAIDTAVYTKNRMFRIVGSSKLVRIVY